MSILGFSGTIQDSIFKTVASVLHLGNIQFAENETTGAVLDIKNPEGLPSITDSLPFYWANVHRSLFFLFPRAFDYRKVAERFRGKAQGGSDSSAHQNDSVPELSRKGSLALSFLFSIFWRLLTALSVPFHLDVDL